MTCVAHTINTKVTDEVEKECSEIIKQNFLGSWE